MKKNLLKFLSLSLLIPNISTPLFSKTLTYNGNMVEIQSKEGKALFESFQEKGKKFQEELRQLGENLKKSNELLQKQAQNAALFSEEKLRKQQSKLNKELRDAERFHQTQKEELEIEYKEKSVELKNKIDTYAEQVGKEKKVERVWDVSQVAGLKILKEDSDITKEVLRVADANFETLFPKTADAKVDLKKDIKSA